MVAGVECGRYTWHVLYYPYPLARVCVVWSWGRVSGRWVAGVILLRALVSTVLRRARHDISLVSLVSLERARLSRTRVSLRLDDHMRARCGRVCVAVGETSRRFAILRGRAIGSL